MASARGSEREPDAEFGAGAQLGAHLDPARVLFDDPERDREPEPGADADRLGGEERIEDPLDVLGRDAVAVVAEAQQDAAALQLAVHADVTAVADRLARVDEEVEEQLLEALRLALERGQALARDLDRRAARRLQPRHARRLLDEIADVRDLALAAAGVRELAHV